MVAKCRSGDCDADRYSHQQ